MAKSIYTTPLTEAITFAPEEHVMDKITIGGSGGGPGVGAPARNGGPALNLDVRYI